MIFENFDNLSKDFNHLYSVLDSKNSFNQRLNSILENKDIDEFLNICFISKNSVSCLIFDLNLILDEEKKQIQNNQRNLKNIIFIINQKNLELRIKEGLKNINNNDLFLESLIQFSILTSHKTLNSITGIGTNELKKWIIDSTLINVSKENVYNLILNFILIN